MLVEVDLDYNLLNVLIVVKNFEYSSGNNDLRYSGLEDFRFTDFSDRKTLPDKILITRNQFSRKLYLICIFCNKQYQKKVEK